MFFLWSLLAVSTLGWTLIGLAAVLALAVGVGLYYLLPYIRARDVAREMEEIARERMEKREEGGIETEEEPGRNDPCPCGSGEKYKRCCGHPARQT